MRKWPWTRDERATAPADPPAADRPSSRSAPEAAGWGRPTAGPTLTGRRRRPPFAARNAVLARLLGDPTDEARRLWLRRLDDWARADGEPEPPADRVVDRFAGLDRASVAVLGDPGAGQAAQQAVAPVAAGRCRRHRPGRGVRRHRCARGRAAVLRGAVAGALRRLPRPDLRRPRVRRLARRPRRLHDRLLRRSARRPRARAGRPPARPWARLVRRLFWRRSPTATPEELAAARWYRDTDAQYAVQPGPYCAVDAGPLRLVLVDTGLTGRVDAEQARWLRAVSAADRAQDPARRPTGVRRGAAAPDPARRRAATSTRSSPTPRTATSPRIGGGDHNYQRYPVRLRDGRTMQYVVAGAAGAPRCRPPTASRTSTASRRPCPRTTSAATRCAATRWRGSAGRTAACSASAASRSARRRDDDHGRADRQPRAAAVDAVRGGLRARARRAAGQIYPLPATGQVLPGDPPPALIEPRRPPLFRSVLRIDATSDEIVVSCFAATGSRRTGSRGPRAGPPRRSHVAVDG